MKYTNEINTMIERNIIEKGNITVSVLFNESNDCILIYTAKNGYFYISFVGTKNHMAFSSYEKAISAANKYGYHN